MNNFRQTHQTIFVIEFLNLVDDLLGSFVPRTYNSSVRVGYFTSLKSAYPGRVRHLIVSWLNCCKLGAKNPGSKGVGTPGQLWGTAAKELAWFGPVLGRVAADMTQSSDNREGSLIGPA